MVYTPLVHLKTNRHLEAVCDSIDYIHSSVLQYLQKAISQSQFHHCLHGLQAPLTDTKKKKKKSNTVQPFETKANIFVGSQLEIYLSLLLTIYYVEDINLTLQKVQWNCSFTRLSLIGYCSLLTQHYRTSHRNWSIKQ